MVVDPAMSSPVTQSVSSTAYDPNDTPQSLVEAAKGDYEGVIAQLMRDKASLRNQNGQLWRLIDKQRAMVLNLQKDFQRVSNERDRYQLKSKRYREEVLRSNLGSSHSNPSHSSDALETNVEANCKTQIEHSPTSPSINCDVSDASDAPLTVFKSLEISPVLENMAINDEKIDCLLNEPTVLQSAGKHSQPAPNEPNNKPSQSRPTSPHLYIDKSNTELSRDIPDPAPNRSIVSLYSSNTDDEKFEDFTPLKTTPPRANHVLRRQVDPSIPRRPRLPSLRSSGSISNQLDDAGRASVEEASRQLSAHIEETQNGHETHLSNITPAELSPDHLHLLKFKVLPTKDDSIIIVGIFLSDKQLWRICKTLSQIVQLNRILQPEIGEQLPHKSLLKDLDTTKLNRAILEAFLMSLGQSRLGSLSERALLDFLTSDIMLTEPVAQPDRTGNLGFAKKEGYLTKRGKSFGGWKMRYFVLDGPILRYYESVCGFPRNHVTFANVQPLGAHLGNIRLPQAQIGRQQSQSLSYKDKNSSDENIYRHAFLVLEAKGDSSNSMSRHVLCAENDEERDDWIEALLNYVDMEIPRPPTADKVHKRRRFTRRDCVEKDIDLGDEDGEACQTSFVSKHKNHAEPSPIKQSGDTSSPPLNSISRPMNGVPIVDKSQWCASAVHKDKNKKKGIWGFGNHKVRMSRISPATMPHSASLYNISAQGSSRSLFGVPLSEAVEHSQIAGGPKLQIPAVVYRCIEFLDAKNSWREEGIYRLSGSSAVINSLRDKFNFQGDFNILNANECYDTHAVAGLLKMYLRELPMSVLSRELHPEFLHAIETPDQVKKLKKVRLLVEDLPPPNLALLKVLCAHLLRIIENSDENKMTIRNVGIVFSPTLNIPAGVFSLFLTEYDSIFGDPSVQ